mmetsp:Transcript_38760/g.95165  ORF Transcript_38760/g.95165 Transcript_38760/m.95165 type:complete len:296 (+) Transcript_38760:879-1766(+)
MKAPTHHSQAAGGALLDTLIPVVPESIQVRTFPEIIRVVSVTGCSEPQHNRLRSCGIRATEHPSRRSSVRCVDRLSSGILIIIDAEVALDGPILESAIDHFSVRPRPWRAAKVFVSEHRRFCLRSVPVRQRQYLRVHTQQSILKLQDERTVPCHKHRSEVGLVPTQVQHSDEVLHHKIVISPKRRTIGSHAIRLRCVLHDPHCGRHVGPFVVRETSHLPANTLRGTCWGITHGTLDSCGSVRSHLESKQHLVVLLEVRRPDHLRTTLRQHRLGIQAFPLLHSHSFPVWVLCSIVH